MSINVRFFAAIREAVGTPSLTLDTQAATVGELRDELIGRGGAWAEALARGRHHRRAGDRPDAHGEVDRGGPIVERDEQETGAV